MTILKIWILVNMLAFALAIAPANAQQPATALQRCGTDVGNLAVRANELAEQLDLARLKIEELQKQIEDAKAAKVKDKKP